MFLIDKMNLIHLFLSFCSSTTLSSTLSFHLRVSSYIFLLSFTLHFPIVLSSNLDCDSDEDKSNPFLWKVTSNDSSKPSYLFGTIHVAYTRVWDDIPVFVKQKFRQSDSVFTELDLLQPSITDVCKYLPNGQKLSKILPNDLYLRLVDHLRHVRSMMPKWMASGDRRYRKEEASNLFRAKTFQWRRKHAIWVLPMIDSLTESQIRSHGTSTLDYYLAQEAQRMGKKTGAVENVEDQCEPMNNLKLSHVIFALNMTLLQHEKIRRGTVHEIQPYEALIEKYKCGNIDSILLTQEQLPSKDDALMTRQIEEHFQQKFIKFRNQKMAQRIVSLLNEQPNESYFFAFGVAHFIGNGSIIDLLRSQGYEIERVINSLNDNRHHQIKSRVNLLRRDETLIARMEPLSRGLRSNYKTVDSNNDEPTIKQAIPLINWLLLACLIVICIFLLFQVTC